MVKAGALLYAIFITFIISVLAGIFLLSVYYNQVQIAHLLKESELTDDISSAANIYLASKNFSKTTIDLFEDGEHLVKVSTSKWGLFDIASFSSEWRHINISEKLLIGSNVPVDERISLYYSNASDKLTLCGNTLINGNVFVPNRNVERGYIEGKGYNKEELIYGQIGMAENYLPKLNSTIADLFKSFKSGKFDLDFETFSFYNYIESADKIVENSFDNQTMVLFSENDIKIEGSLSGNIIIISKGDIDILNTANLHDVIVYGENIKIESGFTGSLQSFATNNIVLEDDCSVLHPSVLCISGKDDLNISIGKNSKIFGDVILLNTVESKNSKLLSEKGSIMQGVIYSNCKVEPRGSVYGTLYCNNLELTTKSSTYSGYLMDAEIDVSKLSEVYIGSNILFENEFKGRIKVLR